MKKKQNYNPLQFSLFEEIKTHKNYGDEESLEGNWESVVEYFEDKKEINNNLKTESNERNLSESNNRERPTLHDAGQRGHGTEIRPSLEGQGTVRHDQGTAAGTIPTDETIKGINSVPSEDNSTIQRENDRTRPERNDGDRSGGNRMATTDKSSRPGLDYYESLLDFKVIETVIPHRNDPNFIVSISLGESLGERAETQTFLFSDFPEESVNETVSYVLNAYKEIVSDPEYANGDFYQQKLHAIAGNVLAAVNKNISEEKNIKEPETLVSNFHSLTAPDDTKSFSKKTKYQHNIAALDLLIKLDNEHRPASPEEQTILAKYVGWGGLKEVLLDPANDAEWKTASDIELRTYVNDVYNRFNSLDPDGSQGLLNAAKRSIINAHYTPYEVINAIYDGVEKAGFKGGNILEPSAGIGNFLAAMPIDMANNSDVTAIEMDRTTGKILQKLFPTAETHITGFEKINLPEDNYDLIISNIPFGAVPIYDQQLANLKDKSYKNASNNIHNYFFAKSILLAKPGSMIAFLTSRYTMDSKEDKGIRELMNDACEFAGAIRLPDNAFYANAGTQVVSDIIFLRKFNLGEEKKQQNNFLNVKSIPFTDHKKETGIISYNEYFHEHPTHMIGQVEFGGLYDKEGFNLKGNKETNLREKINHITDALFEKPILITNQKHANKTEQINAEVERYIKLNQYDSIGNLVVLKDGFIGTISDKFHVNEELDNKVRNLGLNPADARYGRKNLSYKDEELLKNNGIDINDFYYRVVENARVRKDDLPKVKYIHSLREKTKELIYKEAGGYSDAALNSIRADLKITYDEFVFKYGNITDKSNSKVLDLDADRFVVSALEKKDPITGKISPADILVKRTINPIREIHKTDNIQDAITLSLQKFGKLKMNYVSELMDKTYEDIMQSQKGDATFIFKDEKGNHLTREEYLSGNVVEKLKTAQTFFAENPEFLNNVDQLEKVQPKPIAAVDIYSPMHARWIPANYINQFLQETLKTKEFELSFSKSADAYKIDIFDRSGNVAAFATKRKSAAWVFNHALNGLEPKVTYTVEEEGGKTRLVFDPEDTQLAKENYRKIKGSWDDWKYNELNRRETLAGIYNKTFNNTVLRTYDGSHLSFPGLIGFVPRPHQKDAIFRNVQQLGGINDHMVGAGKTLIQVATAMELRRLGMASKPLLIGLKSQIPQLYEQFKKAYPLAKVLFPSEKDFSKVNRKRLLNNIATNDWDAVILSHDQFTRINQPAEIQVDLIKELTDVLREEMSETNDKREKKSLETRLYKYEQKIEALMDASKDKDVLDFSQLGIDFLMVDESQEFKNLEFSTTKKNVRGLGNPLGSKKAFNMLVACRHLQNVHKGDKGIIFSSGTPISNTMAELYLLFKYLRPDKMKETGITSFDRWAANFANDYSDLEYYMGRFKEVHRFREFANLPELLTMYQDIADVRNNSNLTLDKPKAEHTLIKIQPSETQLNLIEKLQGYINSKGNENADELGLTAGYDDRKGINPSFAILAINFAKKLSLDPRLIDSSFAPGTKLVEAANNIAKIYEETNSFKGTQLIFSDIGTPKSSNQVDNLFEHLSGDITQSDLIEIFGEDYYEKKSKPKLDDIKAKIEDVLTLSPSDVDDLVKEANTSENFNVYSEMKRLLIEKGIPENEVVFIHSYNTRKQKEELFEAVNKGDIRIVLGSTKKLGTGVNVQNRAVAGHHLDISWRPSDIEQRNGRFERQGNEAAKLYRENKVDAFYYATERTLDASMYNTVSQKAKFIAQLKTTVNADVRTIKDIEEDIDMGSMAAELSGDPIFKEKANLQKRITELTQFEKSFKSKKYDFESNIRSAQNRIKAFENNIETFKKLIPFIEQIPKDEKGEFIFSGKVAGRAFEKVGEFGLAMITEAEHAKKYKPLDHQFPLGELWGFKVVGRVTRDFFHDTKEIERQIISPVGDQIGDSKSLPNGEVAAGLQIKQAILELPEKIERFSRNIEKEKQNTEEYSKQFKAEFPYKVELETKKERLTEIDTSIIQKAKEVDEAKKQSDIIKVIPLSAEQKQYTKDNPYYAPPHYGLPPLTDEQANSIPDSVDGNKIIRGDKLMLYGNEYGINIKDATYSVNPETNSIDRKIFKYGQAHIEQVKKEDVSYSQPGEAAYEMDLDPDAFHLCYQKKDAQQSIAEIDVSEIKKNSVTEIVDNKKERTNGIDPDANGLYNHDGNDFTDELIEFFEQKQTESNSEKPANVTEPEQDFFTQIDRQYNEAKERDEKSTHQRYWEENKIGLNDLIDERDLKEDKKQQNNRGFKR
jgi:N12 class adenine-specific DNA methylase